MTLPAFAAVRRAAAPLLLRTGACYRLISPAREALSSKPAARCSCCRTTGQTDGRTDGHSNRRTLDHFIDPVPRDMRTVPKMWTFLLEHFDTVGWAAGRASGL